MFLQEKCQGLSLEIAQRYKYLHRLHAISISDRFPSCFEDIKWSYKDSRRPLTPYCLGHNPLDTLALLCILIRRNSSDIFILPYTHYLIRPPEHFPLPTATTTILQNVTPQNVTFLQIPLLQAQGSTQVRPRLQPKH